MRDDLYYEPVDVPRGAVRFPLPLRPPSGFNSEDVATWPKFPGRFEYVEGGLLFMPPPGDVQQDVAIDVGFALRSWSERHPEFVVGGNEAGMLLNGEVRGADAAVWRAKDVAHRTGGFRRVAPVLAVEVAGSDEDETSLRKKADWYLRNGVRVIWLVLPESREVIVLTAQRTDRYGTGLVLSADPELPDLGPAVSEFFKQLSAAVS